MDQGMMSSLRPQARPAPTRPQARPPTPETVLTMDELEKIEKVVWAEANTEGVVGRNAVRGVIFNRLASDRFGDTVDEVLVADEFEPLNTYGSFDEIPVPEDHLLRGMEEIVDYIQLGDDASQGSTFFQNTSTTGSRGTKFNGGNPLKIGKHTFYNSYGKQEPVEDLWGSHNISVTFDDLVEEDMQLAQANFADGGIMLPEEGWAAEGAKYAEENPPADISFKDAATFVAEMTPVIGDAIAAKEVWDELQKEDPNYYLAGALGGAALVGLFPGLGDAAAKAIKEGAKSAAEGAKKVAAKLPEYDPNAVGSFGGNLFAKGFDEPSDETLGLMREKYPNMEARDEVYRVGERANTRFGGTEIKVGPEKPLQEVPLYPEDPERRSVFIDPDRAKVEYDGELYNKIIPTKGALYIEDIIEESDDVIYRGMSAEEYKSALEQGYIKSKGDYNIGTDQEDLTFFSTRPSQAQSYANDYTPEGFKATPDRPAYVVAIKKPKDIDYVTGETEFGIKGEIPTSDIVEVYEGRPYLYKSDVDVREDWDGTKKVYGSSDIAQVTWEKVAEPPTSGVTKTSDIDELVQDAPTNALEEIGLTEEARDQWRSENKVNQRQTRVPQVQQAAKGLMDREITSAEYRELVEGFQPVSLLEEVPDLPTVEEISSALNSDKVRKGIVGVNKGIEDGTYVSSRLDIPAYEEFDTWVVSLHDGTNNSLGGKSIGYAQTAVLTDVQFGTIPKAAANIASGKNKATIARIFGNWQNQDPEEVYNRAIALMDDPEWIQVGMNPFRHSYFYDKVTGEPVISASEVVQVGPLVLAKSAKKAAPDAPMFRINPKDESSPTFALGGLAIARKGITTEDGLTMAEKRFQLDEKKADKNGDGQLSTYEKTAGEAVQKANADEVPELYHGGMPCSCGASEECGCGLMSEPMPVGSTEAEVADDISVMISEGEYVLNAQTVKWHGLKHIMDMQSEAEMGLMGMHDMGLIVEVDRETEEESDSEGAENAEVSDEGDTKQEEEETLQTPEGNEIEMAGIDVDIDESEVDETEDYKDSDYSKKTSMYGIVKKPKVSFIV